MAKLLDRLIAIDTEYHTDSNGHIDKVYCLCASKMTYDTEAARLTRDATFKKWLYNLPSDAETSSKSVLDDVIEAFNINEPIFVCHAFDKAERRALTFLGVDCSRYDFIDTFHLARMLTFNMDKSSLKVVYETDEECINAANKEKAKKLGELSYAGLCYRYKLGYVDTQRKDFMRQLCIQDNTSGYESEILDYCLDDTQFLIPLFFKLFEQYMYYLRYAFCPMFPGIIPRPDMNTADGLKTFRDYALNCLLMQSRAICRMGAVSDRGIPLDASRVNLVRSNALQYKEQLKAEFNKKFPRTYIEDVKTKLLKRCTNNVQYYIYQSIKDNKQLLAKYPKTSTGKLSASKETLKDYFKHDPDSFGEQYRQVEKLITILNKVSSSKDNPLDSIYDGKLWYESLEPYASKTTRNQPRKKFIFGWHKSLYGLMSPARGKWLVELDYSSEETFIQACICNDPRYHMIYASKDIYLAFALMMGYIKKKDWDALSIDELKHKYKNIRNMIKPMILGLSYGMGPAKLAERLKISEEQARACLDKIKVIIQSTTNYKERLCDMFRAGKYKAICTPDGAICKVNPNNFKSTTLINYPFQSAGGMILRKLVSMLEGSDIDIKLLATIHDAIFFEVNENDYDAIEKVQQMMIECANKLLNAPQGATIRVGEPEIIRHGEIWTPEHAFDDMFQALLDYKRT